MHFVTDATNDHRRRAGHDAELAVAKHRDAVIAAAFAAGARVLEDGTIIWANGDRVEGGKRSKSYVRVLVPLASPFDRLDPGGVLPVPRGRIICWAAHGAPPSPLHVADHINFQRSDDRPDNLRWLTPLQNAKHRQGRPLVLQSATFSGRDAFTAPRRNTRDHVSSRGVTAEPVISIEAAPGLVQGTEQVFRSEFGGTMQEVSTTTSGKRAAPIDLGAVLATHKGPDLEPIVDALEAAGFTVHLAIDGVLVGEDRPPKVGARINVHRLTVAGDLRDVDGAPERLVIARGSVTDCWYGRPQRPGHHPWGYGPAPTGEALAVYLRTLLVDDVATVGGAR